MSEIVDAQIADWCQYGDNPEGFPCCPKCREFVWMDNETLETGKYTCGNCKNIFLIEEAK